MRTETLPNCMCPNCGYIMNAAQPLREREDKRGPAIGDVSICLNCGEILEYDEVGVVSVKERTWEKVSDEDGIELRRLQLQIRGRGKIR